MLMKQINFSCLCIAVVRKCCVAAYQFKKLFRQQKDSKTFSKLEDVLFSQFFPSAPSHFSKTLCCAVCLSPLVTSFLYCLLWSLMGRDGLFPPSLQHREKKDGVPNRTGRDEAGQGKLLKLKYYLKYIEFDGTEWRNGILFIPFPHLFGRSSGVKSHSPLSSWQFAEMSVLPGINGVCTQYLMNCGRRREKLHSLCSHIDSRSLTHTGLGIGQMATIFYFSELLILYCQETEGSNLHGCSWSYFGGAVLIIYCSLHLCL